MGLFDSFFEITKKPKESDNEAPPRLNISQPSATPQWKPQPQEFAVHTSPSVSVSADEMEKFKAHFEKLFADANLPGPDYFEFSKMCQAMSTLPDETRFPAVFSGLSIQGLTKQKLIESANHYIAVIDEDYQKFNAAVDQQIIADVQQMRLSSQQKAEEVKKKEELILQLQAEIQKDKQDAESLAHEANEKERKAKEKYNTYKAACEAVKSGIQSDVSKINTLIN